MTSATVEYAYNTRGDVTVTMDTEGQTTVYTYSDSFPHLLVAVNALGTTTTYAYDSRDRLTTVTDHLGNVTVTEHDGLGRVSRREWFGGINTLMQSDKPAGGSWRTKYVYALKAAALGHIISERTMTAWNAQGTPTAWTDKCFHYDLLGHVTLETDANAQVTARVDMEAFGTVLTGGQTGFRLTTKPYDSAAGLYYFWQRWYSCSVGAFVQSDSFPVFEEYKYGFVRANPVAFTDITGTTWKAGQPSCACRACVAATGETGGMPPLEAFCRALIECHLCPPEQQGEAISGCIKQLKIAGWTDANIPDKCGRFKANHCKS